MKEGAALIITVSAALLLCQGDAEVAFPPGEGGRAQRGRMRFVPFPAIAYPAGWGAIPWGCANLSFPTRANFVACSETLAFCCSFMLCFSVAPGLPPRPAQGLTPPLHLRKGFHPLTLFRWRAPWGWSLFAHTEVAEDPVQQTLLHLVAGDFRQGQLG